MYYSVYVRALLTADSTFIIDHHQYGGYYSYSSTDNFTLSLLHFPDDNIVAATTELQK
mgnify:CR=1 FL=1